MSGVTTGISAASRSVASRRHVLCSGAAGVVFAGSTLTAFRHVAAAGRVDGRLQELGVTIPEISMPVANYVPYTGPARSSSSPGSCR